MWDRLAALAWRVRFVWSRRRLDEDVEGELEAHFELLVDRYVRSGMTRHEAFAAARRQLGSTLRVREEVHQMNSLGWVERLTADVRFVRQLVRGLAKMPLFACTAVLTLAVGIGANAAIFSVVEGVLLKPLAYPRPGELLVLDHAAPGLNIPRIGFAAFLYFTYREDGRSFQDVGLWNTGTASVTGLAEPEDVPTLFVTDAILPMLGAQPMLGRVLSKADDTVGAPATVVLTAGYWRSRFGADPSALDRTLIVDGKPRQIVGVLPDAFRFLDRDLSLVVPYQLDREKTMVGNFSYQGIARLKPGVTLDQASADVARMIPLSLQRFPPFPGANIALFEQARLAPNLRTMKDDLVGDVRPVLWASMGMIAIVLLIACANVANLLLVRAESRQQELAVRAALGAGSRQIARELLLESLTLGLLGGLVGLALAFGAVRLILAWGPGNLPRLGNIALDAPVLVFALVLSVLAALLCGAVAVLKYAGSQLATTLRAGGRTASASRERHRARNMLVVAQVALALVLLVSSGLMIRTFRALRDVQPGFVRPNEVLTLRLAIPATQVKDDEGTLRMHQAILEKIQTVPGVTSIALASTVTLSGQGWHDPLYAEDRAGSESQSPPIRLFKFISPGYIQTMGGALVAGRDFTWADAYQRRPVAMVSESLARELWGQPENALGKRIRPYPTSDWREVVGVLSDMRDNGVNQPASSVAYWPLLMANFLPLPVADNPLLTQRPLTYIVRSSRTGTQGFVDDIGRAVWSINGNLPLAGVRTLQEMYDGSLARTSFTLVMLGIAGAMALLLGIAGIYAVVSYSVSQRRREVGIRIALGAQARAVIRMFVTQATTLAAAGVAIGLLVAFGVMQMMSSLLFEVSPADPATYATVTLTLIAAAVIASYVPALRATAVDPNEALQAE